MGQTLPQPQLRQQGHRLFAALALALPSQQRRQLHIFQRRQVVPQQMYGAVATVVEPGQDPQQGGFPRSGLADKRNRLRGFDNQLNSGKDGDMVFTLTDVLTKMMNFKNVFRWHFLFLILLSLVSVRALAADTLLVLGDSLNAGYRMPAARAWPALLRQHKPRWVVIELGGNDGLRGFPPSQIEQDLVKAITLSQQAGAQPLLMQIRLPPNYGKRYTETISAIYPALASRYAVPLLPFFMEQVYLRPEWMQDNGIHPNPDAQPFIAQWMADRLLPLLKHES